MSPGRIPNVDRARNGPFALSRDGWSVGSTSPNPTPGGDNLRMSGPTLRRNVASKRILSVNGTGPAERTDRVAAEEPMEIRVGGPGQEPGPVAVTMRTPGGDFELASGFLFTEGLVRARDEIERVAYCDLPEEEQNWNVVTVRLAAAFDHESVRRNFFSTSSCGICG